MNACSPDSDAVFSLKSPGRSCPAIKSLYISKHLKKAAFPNLVKKDTKSHPDSTYTACSTLALLLVGIDARSGSLKKSLLQLVHAQILACFACGVSFDDECCLESAWADL